MRGKDEGDLVVIAADGSVRAGERAQALLAGAKGSYRLLSMLDGVLVLKRVSGHESRLLMAGEIATPASVMEAVSVITQSQWAGVLSIHGAGTTRRLTIAEGALKAAWSGVAQERLGEVMTAIGLITADELARCVLDVGPERRFGEIAVERGFVSREQLFEALRIQMRRIFQSALLERSGHYAMVQVDDSGEDTQAPEVLLHVPLQGLLMESVQRIDEMSLFRERIPSGECCPVATPRAAGIALGDSLRPVMALADGEHSILDIARALRSDEYLTTKRVAQLLQVGAVEIKAQRKLDEAEATRMIARFNQVLKLIFDTAARYGSKSDIHWTLSAWVRDTALARFFDGALRPEGTIDAARAVSRLAIQDDDRPLDALQQALHELAAFAMISASGALPREAERTLSRLVSQKLTHLRRAGD
jgi:hypothetical protein